MNTLQIVNPTPEMLQKTGHWSADEHARFLLALEHYKPGQWKCISKLVITRTAAQVRCHWRKTLGKEKSLQSRKKHDVDLSDEIWMDWLINALTNETTDDKTLIKEDKLIKEDLIFAEDISHFDGLEWSDHYQYELVTL